MAVHTVVHPEIPGVRSFLADVHEDHRGSVFEFDSAEVRAALGRSGVPLLFSHKVVSTSVSRVFRGMHFQLATHPQGKLVWLAEGSIVDFVMDVRAGSPGYGRLLTIKLRPGRAVWVPPGCAHGFLAEVPSVVVYECTGARAPSAERVIQPRSSIAMLNRVPILRSERDRDAPWLHELTDNDHVYAEPAG